MATSGTALAGIRVLDLGRYHAGPRIGLVLARLGAEVIKIENIGGDESRRGEGSVRGQSVYWAQHNSGKKSICLDLHKEKGKAILKELVKVSDVIAQNYRPGTMDEMGLSYDTLHGLNPRIIMVNVSAYGQYGPYRDRVGFDPMGEGISGLMSITGYPENPPTRSAGNIIDRITALHGTIGVLAALRERDISGQGQTIDVCLADTGFSLTEIPVVHYLENGTVAKREGNRIARAAMNIYQTKDGWAMILAPSPRIWARLCECIGKPEWAEDPNFTRGDAREKNINIIEKELGAWFLAKNTEEAVDIMAGAGVPCGAVNDIAKAAQSPHVWERELLVKVLDPVAGTIHVGGNYVKLGRSESVIGRVAAVGEHTEEILNKLLKYTPDRIKRLREEKVIQ